MKLIIEDDEGRRTVVPIVRDELYIGRADTSTVRLSEKNVSRKHARLLREEGRFFIEDLQSFTGVRVNGERVLGKRTVTEGDLIQISEYDLMLQAAPGEQLPASDHDGEIVDEDVIITGPIPEAGGGEAERDKETAVIRMADVSGAGQAQARDLNPTDQPRLLIEAGLPAAELPLTKSPVAIGRASENDVVLDDPTVSRYHCKLFLEGDTWKLLDNRSAHGVKVNGEAYATCRVQPGDALEIGKIKLRFLAPGQPATAAAAAAPAPEHADTPTEVSKAAPRPTASRRLFALGAVALAAIALAVYVVQRNRRAPNPMTADDDGVQVVAIKQDVIQASLGRARQALLGHRFAEALQHFDAAQKAGATAEEVRGARIAQAELREEQGLRKLDAAIAAQRFDEAKLQLDTLGQQPGWFADQERSRAPAVKKGYVDDHLARAEAMRAQSVETCAAEAQLALAADPASARAQELHAACTKPRVEQATSRPPAPTPPAPPPVVKQAALPPPRQPLVAKTVDATPPPPPPEPEAPADPDTQSRKLVAEGNQKLLAEDFESALALFHRALALRPSQPVLATLYRSMGITLTRQGKLEEGAHYYRLYLPLCTNEKEREYLTRTLEEYEARRR